MKVSHLEAIIFRQDFAGVIAGSGGMAEVFFFAFAMRVETSPVDNNCRDECRYNIDYRTPGKETIY